MWFVLVRRTRDNMDDKRISNEFTDEKSSLKKWIDLKDNVG